MADIFLSYSSDDRERIRPLVHSLEQRGWSVWWDRRIPPGKTWHQVIQQALDGARCVVVAWSKNSIESDWVITEAEEGKTRGVLIPVLIDDVRPPLGFRMIQAARLIGWQSPAPHPELDLLFETISGIVGKPEFDEGNAFTDSPAPAPVFAPPVQPTSIHSIPAIQPLDRSGVSEPGPRKDDPVSVEKVRRQPGRSLLPKLAGFIPAKRRAGAIAAAVAVMALLGYGAWSGLSGGNGNAPSSTGAPTPAAANVTIQFETVTLDDRGNEIKREKKEAKGIVEDLGNGVKLEMVEIPGGSFTMGSNDSEYADERPAHQVKVSGFWMGRFEVTREQWREVARMTSFKSQRDLAEDPSRFKDSWKQPAENVGWEAAVEFCARLSRKTGKTYRLPTEAEWEYAARAGTTTPFAFGPTITPRYVNYNGKYPYGNASSGEDRGKTIPVGDLRVANAFGLFDMHGNVWEWCQDWYGPYPNTEATDPTGPSSGSYRVFRGGGWYLYAVDCRSADRYRIAPGDHYDGLGFRLLRTYR
jgi:formylglycine-generating enzyme required for sulfatase activity